MQSQDSAESENQIPAYKNNWVLDMIRTRAARVFWAYVATFISFFIFGIWLVSQGNIESGIKAFFFVNENGFTGMSYIEMAILIACACFLVIKVKTVLRNCTDPESHPVYRKICQWGDPVSIGEQARQELSNPRFQPGSSQSFSLSTPLKSSWIITNHYLIQSRFFYFDILRMEDLLWAYKKKNTHTTRIYFLPVWWNTRFESILICYGGSATFEGPEHLIDKILAHCVENASWAIFGYFEQLENHFNKNNSDFCAIVESNKRFITKIKENQNLAVKPGNVETTDLNNEVKLEVLLISSGKFIMGSPVCETNRKSNETQHEVTLTKPFYIGKYQVTQEQWEAVMGNNPSNTKGAKLPVTDVSWEDCQEFIKKLNDKTDGGFRLPTEAEWEYSCRAGSNTAYSWGDSITKNDANFEGPSTQAVGSYNPNAFGVYDMHGNVWEWCADRYDADYPAGLVMDPKGPLTGYIRTGNSRVLRGGSFSNVGSSARSSNRISNTPTCRYNNFGFRLARTILFQKV